MPIHPACLHCAAPDSYSNRTLHALADGPLNAQNCDRLFAQASALYTYRNPNDVYASIAKVDELQRDFDLGLAQHTNYALKLVTLLA